jgi:LCP family protein required for cell wall assembly
MNTLEEEVRAAFARHEDQTPAAGPVRAKIEIAAVRAKRRRTFRRLAGVAAAVLLAGAAVPTVLQQWQPEAYTTPLGDLSGAPAGPLDVLLLGSDSRLSAADPKDRRADTVMLVHVPADRSRTYVVSLPRDGAVKLPDGRSAKLSSILPDGGPKLAEQVVSDLTGVDFDATVTVDLQALRAVTEAVGGVEMCLAEEIVSLHNGKRYPRGCQQIGADDITPVLRARYGLAHGAYDRDRNAQRFLRALAEKLSAQGTLTDPVRLGKLLAAARTGIEIDGDGTGLLRVAGSLASAEVVGLGSPTFNTAGDGRELPFPEVGPSLYAALRDDALADWATANPTYVLK